MSRAKRWHEWVAAECAMRRALAASGIAPRCQSLAASALTLALVTSVCAVARADNATAALDELKQGYALKQANDCPRAVPHLEQSLRFSPTPKAMLNLADCELRMGNLTNAKEHAAAGRTLALILNDGELVAVADAQLASLERRLAWLTVRLAPGAPTSTQVTRDRDVVPPALFGVPEAVNPGTHTLVASAPARAPREISVTIAEGERSDVTVEPSAAPAMSESSRRPKSGPSIPFYTALGVGVVGLTVGIATGIAAQSKHAALEGECGTGGLCPSSAAADIDDFHTLRTWSTVGYGAGAAGVVAATILWFVLPRQADAITAHLRIDLRSATVTGTL